jgi:prepilin-type N-terminal cleavage/methylation domain-containing protein
MKRKQHASNDGFTLIELMIALSVLSVLLVMSTVILINIGALYTKGVNAANLQKTSRNLVGDISAVIQLSGTTPRGCTNITITCYTPTASIPDTGVRTNPHPSPVSDKIYGYCINNVRYSYVLNRELGTDEVNGSTVETPHVIWRDTLVNKEQPCKPLNISEQTVQADAYTNDKDGSGKSTGYEIAAKKNRLTRFLVAPTSSNNGVYNVQVWMAYGDSDLVNTETSGTNMGHSSCNGGSGTQFCSISEISTTVTGRVY